MLIYSTLALKELTGSFNHLSANVEYTPHEGDVICTGCSALCSQNH